MEELSARVSVQGNLEQVTERLETHLARISHRRRVHRSPCSGKVVVWQRLLEPAEGTPMPTECSVDLFGFASVEGRRVEAAFDGGSISSNAGALLLGSTDRAVRLVDRFAA